MRPRENTGRSRDGSSGRVLHVAIIADFLAEFWPSMDLVAERLVHGLDARRVERPPLARNCPGEAQAGGDLEISAHLIRPVMRRFFSRAEGRRGPAYTLDRLVNRYVLYPAWLWPLRRRYDVFHIADHSYSHLAFFLPPARTVITCHDADAFEAWLDDDVRVRHWPRKLLSLLLLHGLRRSAAVCCDSQATADALAIRAKIDPRPLTVIPLGHQMEHVRLDLRGGSHQAGSKVTLLHVGSTIPRKRIDVLLRVVARLRQRFPDLVLARVGGAFTPDQLKLIAELDMADTIEILPFLSIEELEHVYAGASLLLMTTEAEGFGLPLLEAMACGLPVLASNLPVLREIGCDVADYAEVGDIDQWVAKATALLHEHRHDPVAWEARKRMCVARSKLFSWERTATAVADVYASLVADPRGASLRALPPTSGYGSADHHP